MRLDPETEARLRHEAAASEGSEYQRREESLARVLRKARGGRPKKRKAKP